MAEIIESHLTFTNLTKRNKTDYIVIHHSATNSNLSVQEIHEYHQKSLGWAGIGYNFYITKQGKIYTGRPIDTVGAHCENYNSVSVGVCLCGNFEIEKPTEQQLNALRDLLKDLKAKYPNAKIVGHKDLNATACPGKNLYSKLGSLIANAITPKEEYVKVFLREGKFSVVLDNGKKFTYSIPKGGLMEDFIADLSHGLKITN